MKLFQLNGVDIVLRHVAAIGPVEDKTTSVDEVEVYQHSSFRIYLIGATTIYPDVEFKSSDIAADAREALAKAVENIKL